MKQPFAISNQDLPAGTVTFLFTDIEGSTKLLRQLGDEYATVLADQRRILRDIFAKWHGREAIARESDANASVSGANVR